MINKDFIIKYDLHPILVFFIVMNHLLLSLLTIFVIGTVDNGKYVSLIPYAIPLLETSMFVSTLLAFLTVIHLSFVVYKAIKKHRKIHETQTSRV